MTAVLITNGRGTASFARKWLDAQSIGLPVITIQDRMWLDANMIMLDTAPTDLVLRVDDDMFLHPRAVEFMMSNYHGTVAHVAKLYEHWEKRPGGKIKIYNVPLVKRMGGFRIDRQGKIDRPFEKDTRKYGMDISAACKKSVVGLHACASYEDCLEYEKLWCRKKRVTRHARKYDKSVEWQSVHTVKIVEGYNRRHNTEFWKWLKK